MPDDEVQARRRGMYPRTAPGGFGAEQLLVTVSMDKTLYEWLASVVGQTSFTESVEETIVTLVRTMRGELPVYDLLEFAAKASGKDKADVLFGHCNNRGDARGHLKAAHYAATGPDQR